MNQELIIELAMQAGFVEYELDDGTTNAFDKRYERFAALVAAAEREACAKVADEWSKRRDDVGGYISRNIRARGEKK